MRSVSGMRAALLSFVFTPMPETIRFIRNEVRLRIPAASKIPGWLRSIARKERARIGELNYIFCSDQYLLALNREHLGHDYFTDIITFDLSEDRGTMMGEIYISVDRVRENASTFGVSFSTELYRVMAHGLLHLLGYKDKKKEDKAKMRLKEDACLSLLLGSTWNKK